GEGEMVEAEDLEGDFKAQEFRIEDDEEDDRRGILTRPGCARRSLGIGCPRSGNPTRRHGWHDLTVATVGTESSSRYPLSTPKSSMPCDPWRGSASAFPDPKWRRKRRTFSPAMMPLGPAWNSITFPPMTHGSGTRARFSSRGRAAAK